MKNDELIGKNYDEVVAEARRWRANFWAAVAGLGAFLAILIIVLVVLAKVGGELNESLEKYGTLKYENELCESVKKDRAMDLAQEIVSNRDCAFKLQKCEDDRKWLDGGLDECRKERRR